MFDLITDYIELNEGEWKFFPRLSNSDFNKSDRTRRLKIENNILTIEKLIIEEEQVKINNNLNRVIKKSYWKPLLKQKLESRYTKLKSNFDLIIDFRILAPNKYLIGIFIYDQWIAITDNNRPNFIKISNNENWNYTENRNPVYNY